MIDIAACVADVSNHNTTHIIRRMPLVWVNHHLQTYYVKHRLEVTTGANERAGLIV